MNVRILRSALALLVAVTAACAGNPAALAPPTIAPNAATAIVPHAPGAFVHAMATRERALPVDPFAFPHTLPLLYHHGAIQTVPSIYVVYWGFHTDPDGEAARLTAFFKAVGGSPWLRTVTQYYQAGPVYISSPAGQLRGTWTDLATPVALHPTDADVAAEAVRLAEHFGVYSRNAAYFVATPSGHNSAGFGKNFCSYHSDVSTHGADLAYTNFPYMTDGGFSCGNNSVNRGSAGRLDGVSIIAGHELAETQTDPGNGGWWDAPGNEIADKCAWWHLRNTSFGAGGTFPTQPLWSNAAPGCVQ